MTTDWFLRLDPIKGDSTHDRHAGEIDVLSWSWGVSATAAQPGGAPVPGGRPLPGGIGAGAGAGAGAGKPSFQDLSLAVTTGRAAGELVRACASGQHLAKAVLSGSRGGSGQPFDHLTVTLSDVAVSSTQISGSGGDDHPIQTLTLSYAKVEVVTRVQDARGQLSEVRTGWDVRQNKGL